MSRIAPEQAAVHVVRTIPRRYVALGLVGVAIVLVAALVLVRNDNMRNQPASSEAFTLAPSSLLQSVTHVPAGIVNAVGVTTPWGPTTPPSATHNPSTWLAPTRHGAALPVVFFYGAEFAPYAAAERWPMVVALSRFGSFGQVGLMQSSPTTVFPDLSTFTFWRSTYSSKWISLQTVERYSAQNPTGGGYQPLQRPTPRQAASVSVDDTNADTFPLLDIANHYTLVGSSFAPSVLAGQSQSQIAADLAYVNSPVTQAVIAAANEITAAICTVTGQQPAIACDARGVTAADNKMGISKAG
jgi:uncharacterized protein DUF929